MNKTVLTSDRESTIGALTGSQRWLGSAHTRREFLHGVAGAMIGLRTVTANRPTFESVSPALDLPLPALSVAVIGLSIEALTDPTIPSRTATVLGGLVSEFLTGANSDFRLRPQLATAWRSNDTSTVWTFDIRRGVALHDGRLLDAATIVAHFRKILAAGHGGQLQGIVPAAGVTAPTPGQVKFSLNFPFGMFPYLVSSDNPPSAIVVAAKPGAKLAIVGSGPFALDRISVASGSLMLRPHPTYWGVRPRISAIIAFVSGGVGEDLANGRAQVLPLVPENSVIPKLPDWQIRRANSTAHVQIHLRTTTGAFADVRLRRALAIALDRKALADALPNGVGIASGDNPIPSYSPFGSGTVPESAKVAASRLIAAATTQAKFQAAISCQSGSLAENVASGVASQAQSLGLGLTTNPTSDYLKQQWLISEVGATFYPHGIADSLLVAATLGSDGAWNASAVKDAQIDAAIRALSISRALPESSQAVAALGMRLSTIVPILTPVFLSAVALVHSSAGAVSCSPHGQLIFG